jgi:hypothetical protein
MNNDADDRDLDRTDADILTADFPDEALEAAANMLGAIPTASIDIVPPNCC